MFSGLRSWWARMLPAVLFACPGLAVAAEASMEAARLLVVELRVIEPLRLVHVLPDEGGPLGLAGRVEVTVRNTSQGQVAIWRPDSHGLLFHRPGGGEIDLLVCHFERPPSRAADREEHMQLKRGPAFDLGPGSSRKFVLDHWVCSENHMRPPAAGSYKVSYHLLTVAQYHTNMKAVRKNRRRWLVYSDPLFWSGSASSPPQKVELIEPPVPDWSCPEGSAARGARPPGGFRVWCEQTGEERLLHGPMTEWHPNGKKARQGSYRDGAEVGEWRSWDEQGREIPAGP